jgi:hypothetical protein
MPNTTSCACTGNICAECFYRDFCSRQHLHFIYTEGNVRDVATCDVQSRMEEIFFLDFYTDYFGAPYDLASLNAACYRGRTCPFCNILQLWRMMQVPRVLATTGRLTFWSPAINWNAPQQV